MAQGSARSARPGAGALMCVLLAVVAPACAGRGRPPEQPRPAELLKRAVLRTLDEGSARVVVRVRSSPGTIIVVEGVTSLVGPQASVRATVEGRPDLPSSGVRVTAEGAWLRLPGSTQWVAVDPALAAASPAGSWGGVLGDLGRATDVTGGGRRVTAMVAGGPATVVLDGQGRVWRVHRQHDGLEVSLELSDFGVGVEVDPP